MIDREQLVADLAKAHGIRVDPDDPILIAALLNRRILDESMTALESAVRVSADRITVASLQHLDAARQSASVLITEAGEWSAARLKAAGDEAANAVLHRLQLETAKAERASRSAFFAAWIAGGMCAIGIAGVAGFVLAGIGHGF
jgi:hypothetical protein